MTPKGGARPGAGRKPMAEGQRKQQVSLVLPPSLTARLNAQAEASGQSRSELIAEALEAYLSDHCIVIHRDLAEWLRADAASRNLPFTEHTERILLEYRARFEARHLDSLRGE